MVYNVGTMTRYSTSVSGDSDAGHYKERDLFYWEVWGDHVHHGLWVRGGETASDAVVQLSGHVISSAGVQAGFRVCDIGCGYDGRSRLMTQAYGADVTGITRLSGGEGTGWPIPPATPIRLHFSFVLIVWRQLMQQAHL